MSDNRDRKWDKRRKREKPKRLKVIKRLLKENLRMIGQPTNSEQENYSKEVRNFLTKCTEHWPLMDRLGENHPEIKRIVNLRKEEGMDLLWEYSHRNWR